MAQSNFNTRSTEVLAALRAGVSIADAARANEVTPRTIFNWIRRGREAPDGRYGGFAAAVEEIRKSRQPFREPLGEAELRVVVSERARRGDVGAMRLSWKILKGRPTSQSIPGVDELARRRSQASYRRRSQRSQFRQLSGRPAENQGQRTDLRKPTSSSVEKSSATTRPEHRGDRKSPVSTSSVEVDRDHKAEHRARNLAAVPEPVFTPHLQQ